jgi:sucrose-6F-phosphate phosphohydrolase
MRLLLCTDLDRTLLPNGAQPESKHARQRFARLAAHPQVCLAYVSGRDRVLVQKAIKNFQIPVPDYVIADVGSTIYQVVEGEWQHWQAWEDEIGQDWQGWHHRDLHASLKGLRDLRLQPMSKQNTHKLSYYVPLYVKHQALLETIYGHFSQQGLQVNLIWSIDEQANIGLLDILPASAGKRHAIEFLMQQLGYSLDETVFAGDSGNDISVMESPIHSVLVANANKEVKQQAIQHAAANEQLNSLYIAQGNYLGMNGNYSAGILEGVAHYLPQTEAWFGDDNA